MKQRIEASRIAPNLYMGSKPLGGHAVSLASFDVLVLCAVEHQPPASDFPAVRVIHCPLDDSGRPMTAREWRAAQAASTTIAGLLRRGARVLVTCQQGRNRSGLVVALVLQHMFSLSGRSAIARVRAKRTDKFGPVLVNPHFVASLASLAPEGPPSLASLAPEGTPKGSPRGAQSGAYPPQSREKRQEGERA